MRKLIKLKEIIGIQFVELIQYLVNKMENLVNNCKFERECRLIIMKIIMKMIMKSIRLNNLPWTTW